MFFLIRSAFWLFLVCAFLPVERPADAADMPVTTFTAITAAQSTIADLAGFCDRNPDACEAGRMAAGALSERAQTGAVAVYQFLTNKGDALVADSGFDTLSASDRETEWQAPDA